MRGTLERVRHAGGQSTVEYIGLVLAIGVLLLAVGSQLKGGGGIGSAITSGIKDAITKVTGDAVTTRDR